MQLSLMRKITMKLCKKITGGIAKVAEVICMIMIAAMVVVIVAELINRNFLGKSFRPTIEICGIAFLWMAFIGLIPLYQNSGLMRLEFLLSKAKGALFEVLFFINKIFSLMLGIVMVVAFVAQYPFVSTRFYSTFQFQLPYTVQYFPMAVAGVFMALKTLEQIVERILMLCGKLPKE